MNPFIEVLSKEGNIYCVNLANIVSIKKLDEGMLINFTNAKVLYTQTSYEEFLKLSGQNNQSIYNDPNIKIEF